jgi:homocitrate synthase
MCPTPDDGAPAPNGATTNGVSNGTNGVNGSVFHAQYPLQAQLKASGHPGFTGIDTKPTPKQNRNPYQPVGDFLSNISRFQIIESTLREGEQYVKTTKLVTIS